MRCITHNERNCKECWEMQTSVDVEHGKVRRPAPHTTRKVAYPPKTPEDALEYMRQFHAPITHDKQARKEMPLCRGVLDYFPNALLELAKVSFKANEQHNPGEPMHWARAKSGDQADTLLRHLIERGTIDDDGLRHSAKLAWRALALLQEELEAEATRTRPAQSAEDRCTDPSPALRKLGQKPTIPARYAAAEDPRAKQGQFPPGDPEE